jgi:hypothetical protein
MPSQLDKALAELRAHRPQASPELRDRVQMLARLEPAPRRPLLRRRVVFALAAAALLVAAVAVGIAQRGERAAEEQGEALPSFEAAGRDEATPETAALAPDTSRLQDYRAELTVRVDDVDELGRRTTEAMRIAQSLGGYVVSASYDGGETDSLLVLRVPIGRAQEAIRRLSGLGTLASQRFSLQDLQAQVDQLDDQVETLQGQIAELEQQLEDPDLTRQERALLRSRLEQAQQELALLLDQREATVAQGRSAEITLTLTADRAESSGGVIDDAVDALRDIWVWALAVLIVGAPFVALIAIAFLAGRRLRRRANEKLLGA